MNGKLPLIPKYCLFIYFCDNTMYNIIVPNLTGGTGKEAEQRKRKANKTEIERNYQKKNMKNKTKPDS